MTELGIFVWLYGVGIRTIPKEDRLIHHYKFKDEHGWLAMGKHAIVAPLIIGVWRND